MRMPTEAELNAIPVEDHEIDEWLGYVMQLEKALHKARIPLTLDWALVLLRFAAQTASLQNMPQQYFRMLCDECFDVSNERQLSPPKIEIDISSYMNLNWQARVSRVANAITKSKLTLGGAEALFGLVLLPAQICVRAGATRELWARECDLVWARSENALIDASKANQA